MITSNNKRLSRIAAAASCLLLTGLVSCARREPAPLEILGAAKMAVHEAERGDHTAQLAPIDLQNAQQKLINAELAMNRQDNTLARRLSEQAIVDAQLAKAKTLTAQTNLGVHEERDALHDVERGSQQ